MKEEPKGFAVGLAVLVTRAENDSGGMEGKAQGNTGGLSLPVKSGF